MARPTAHRHTHRSASAHQPTTSRALLVLSIVMLINALSYGIVIPLLYTYAQRFGINPVGLSLLIVSYALAQFLATPVIGRLSDRYGRKVPLLLCLLGSSVALGMFAMATNVWWLFVSRLVDGITGGNISVAQAVISDLTKGKERTKAFGILGAAFGFGFLVGPALGGALGGIHVTLPFWFAAALALLGVLLGWWLLPETLSTRTARAAHAQAAEPLFRPIRLFQALFQPAVGLVLVISLLCTMTQSAWIIAFQSFTVDQLQLNPTSIGILFTISGIVSVVMQGGALRWLINMVPSKKSLLSFSLLLSALAGFGFIFTNSFLPFLLLIIVYAVVQSPINAMITGLLSERTKSEDQGGVLGLNQSYNSVGQIVGPLLAGLIIGRSVNLVFAFTALLLGLSFLISIGLYHRSPPVDL